MTTEEKLKAYDEALSRAKECYTDGLSLHQPVKDVLEHIFPELKENEDEKIRKAIVELVKCQERSGYTLLNNVSTSSMLDWLEKQGEKIIPNMSDNKNNDIDICDTCKDGQYCSKSNYVKSHCWRRE